MDDPNITIEEYIRLEEEKAQRHGQTFNLQTATYGKMEYYDDEDDNFMNFETEYPAIVFDDTSDATLSCKPMISPLNNNEIDFKISFNKSDNEGYIVIFDENSFSYKLISINNWETDLENENDKVNMPLSLSPEPTIGYIDDLDFFKYFENEFPAIAYNNDLKSKSNPLIEPSYLFRHAERRKSRARLSGGYFIGYFTAHFGLPDVAAGAPRAIEDAPVADEGAQGDPAPVQAPQPPQPSPKTI
nr:hypothetical protein [Tanacetum cinerariifolium]